MLGMRQHLKGRRTEEERAKEHCCQGPNTDLQENSTKLICAVKNEHRKCLNVLLESGVCVNSIDTDGRTALMFAVKTGNSKICTVLIEAGADVNAICKSGKRFVGSTALAIAAEKGQEECLALLLKSGAAENLGFRSADQESALSCAARYGHHKCVEMLLKAGIDVDENRPRSKTALIEATQHDQVKCVRSLLQGGACANYQDIHGATSLTIAAINGYDQSMGLLLEAGADVNLVGGSYYDDCTAYDIPLILAAARGHDNCVNLLLKAGSDANTGVPNALMSAARGYRMGCIALLILGGADVNMVGPKGETALLYATSNNHTECVDFLLNHGATMYLDEALAEAVKFNFGKCIRSLVKAGANPNLYQNAVTPLIRASCSGDAETVADLIKAGADINVVNAKYPFGQSLDFSFDSEDEIDTSDNTDGNNDSEIYLNQKELEIEERKDGDDDNDYDDEKYDDDYVDSDYYVGEKLLFCNYCDDHNESKEDDVYGTSDYYTRAKAIFHAAANGHHECLDLLLKAGADVNDRNPRGGNTPLIRASFCTSDECERTLRDMEDKDDEDDVYAVNLEYQGILAMSQPHKFSDLIKMEPKSYHYSPWKKATHEDFVKCVMLLVNAGADVNAINASGGTALLATSNSGNAECVRALLAAGADVNKKNKFGDAPVTLAAGGGADESLKLLLQAGVSDDMITPSLITAAEKGKTMCIDLLLEAGANVNARSNTGETPLLFAAKKEYRMPIDALQLLINSGADVNTMDREKNTALHFVASVPHLKAVKLLLLAGAHVNITDNWGETALQKCLNSSDKMFRHKGRASDVVMVLFAAGDSFDPSEVKTSEMLYFAKEPKIIVSTLKEMMVPQMILKDMCRHLIRAHLISINSHLNLLVRVPKLGLPHSLVSYVLFHGDNIGTDSHGEFKFEDPNMSETLFQCHNKDRPCYKILDRCKLSKSELLMTTILAGHNDCAESLIRTGLDVNLKVSRSQTTVMNAAAKYGSHYVLKLLIEAGADVNLTDRSGETALMFAAENNHHHCINMLIQAGADVNKQNCIQSNALFKAARHGHIKCVDLLISSGSDHLDKALVAAISEGYFDCVLHIFQSGADVNLKEYGSKYMHNAISSGHVACVRLFIGAGVDVNSAVSTFNSALLSAVGSNKGASDQMISLLLSQGAQVNHKNVKRQGALAYYIAHHHKVNKKVAMLLLAAGELLREKKVTCYGSPNRQVDVPLYLKRFQWDEEEGPICLKEFCRETIRKHLKEIDIHSNFFMRIPKTGLPPLLQTYLLYDVLLDATE